MKKLLAILMLLFVLVFAVACGEDPVNTETGSNTQITDTQTDTGSDTDQFIDTDTDIDTSDNNSDGENLNDILGPDWTLPQQ